MEKRVKLPSWPFVKDEVSAPSREERITTIWCWSEAMVAVVIG